jgi:hypothetical protein
MKKRLKTGYSVIKHIVQEVFGIDTKINLVNTIQPTKIEEPTKVVENHIEPTPITHIPQQPTIDVPKEPITIASEETEINIPHMDMVKTIPMQDTPDTTPKEDSIKKKSIDESRASVAGSDVAFSSQQEVDNHHLVKDIKNTFGHNVEIHVKKANK